MAPIVLALLLAQAPSVEQSIGMKTVAAAQISPDGKWVAWTETAADWEQNAYVTQILVASRLTGERWQLTQGKKSSSSPTWAPDSKTIAFGSDRDGKRQVYVISPSGGEARAVTASEMPVGGFDWAPDGKSIAYDAPETESKEKKERKEKYGEFAVIEGDYENSALWVVRIGDEKPKPEAVTKASEFHVTGFAWSPDGSQIAFSAAKDPDLSHRDTTELYAVRVMNKSVRTLAAGRGAEANPMWSPDGRQVAYVKLAGEPDSYLNSHLMVVTAEGSASRRLAEKFDENPSLSAWCASGIYVSGMERTSSALFRVDPGNGSHHKIGVAGAASFSKDCSAAAYTMTAPNQPSEVWVTDLKPFASKKLTHQARAMEGFQDRASRGHRVEVC